MLLYAVYAASMINYLNMPFMHITMPFLYHVHTIMHRGTHYPDNHHTPVPLLQLNKARTCTVGSKSCPAFKHLDSAEPQCPAFDGGVSTESHHTYKVLVLF